MGGVSHNLPNVKMRSCLLSIFSFLLIQPSKVDAANILALLVTPSKSHHIWNRPLMLELAARGHNVTVVSPDPEKEKIPNHTDIIIEGMYEEVHDMYDYEAMSQETILQNTISIFTWGTDGCKKGLNSKGAKQLMGLVGKQTFDLIIVEAVIDECFLGFVPLFGSPPLMAITAYSSPSWASDMTGSPNTPSYISVCNLPYSDHMTFFQRAANFFLLAFTRAYRSLIHLPLHDKIAREYFGPDIPSIADIEKNITVVLTNIHYSFDYPRPLTPAHIAVGGMHVKPAKPLPKDLKKYIDDAPHGVIYFSLGSNVRSDKLDVHRRNALLQAFSQLKQKVLWKWESDTLPGQPANVRVSKWLPQNDILGHPNVRLFITHSGLMSTQEALYHGVPMVGMPFLADQYINLEKNILRGVAEKLDYNTLTAATVVNTLQKVLDDPGYRERMKHLSALFRDRPDSALNTAVWWTEYVIRHKGAKHMLSAGRDMPWYKYFLVDVLSVVFGIIFVILLLFIILVKKVKDMYCKPSKDTTKKKNS